MTVVRIPIALSFVVAAAAASAQTMTLGDLLDRGAQRLTPAEAARTMDAGGKRCVAVDLPAFRMEWKECGYPMRLGGQVDHVASETGRSAPAVPYLATAIVRP